MAVSVGNTLLCCVLCQLRFHELRLLAQCSVRCNHISCCVGWRPRPCSVLTGPAPCQHSTEGSKEPSCSYVYTAHCYVSPRSFLQFTFLYYRVYLFKPYLLTMSFKLHLFLFVPVRIHTLISCTAMTATSCTIFWAEWGLNVLGCGLLVLLPVMDMTVSLLKIFMSDSGACV